MKHAIPNWFFRLGIVAAVAALLPLAWIARTRVSRSPQPRVHVVQDMDNTLSYKRQQGNPTFADGRSMRLPVAGTVARGELRADEAYYLGRRGEGEESWVRGFPGGLTAETMQRGRERYDIYCSPCHGLAGYGDGMVARRAEERQQATWVPPTSLHDELVRSRPEGHLFNTITNGLRTMPAYGASVPVEDRWAIVAYVRALQRSQHAATGDVPADARAGMGP